MSQSQATPQIPDLRASSYREYSGLDLAGAGYQRHFAIQTVAAVARRHFQPSPAPFPQIYAKVKFECSFHHRFTPLYALKVDHIQYPCYLGARRALLLGQNEQRYSSRRLDQQWHLLFRTGRGDEPKVHSLRKR